jgi:hypothetical protein
VNGVHPSLSLTPSELSIVRYGPVGFTSLGGLRR